MLLAVGNATQSHEGAMLRKELAERRSCHAFNFCRLHQAANRTIPRLLVSFHHEQDNLQHAVWDIAFLKLLFARSLDKIPTAIPERQLQLPELHIATGDRERCVPSATRRFLQHPYAVRASRDAA